MAARQWRYGALDLSRAVPAQEGEWRSSAVERRMIASQSLPEMGGMSRHSSGRRSERSSGRAYSRASSRDEIEGRRTARSARHSARSNSSFGSFRSGGRGHGLDGTRYAPWVSTHATSAHWNTNPKHRTVTELKEARAAAMRPHSTFDVDGDGVVSSTDFYLANKFDDDGNGVLDDEERTELRKKMVEKTVAEYRRLPRAKGKETEELIKDFTKHIDETVRAPDFVEKFNKLQIQTRISATSNSTQMEQSLQPLVVQQRDRIIGAFKQFDENGDGVVSWDEFRTGIRGVAPSVPAAAIEDMIHSMDKDGDGEIDYLEFSKKYGSAKTDPKTKQVMETVATGGAKNTRVKGQELDTYRMQKLPFAGHQSRSAMFKTRKLDYKRMADGKLSDIEKRYVRGHLQLHPQLMFFNKEF